MTKQRVILTGQVCTLNPQQPRAQAVALDGEWIQAVGSERQIKACFGVGAQHIECGEHLILPGFIDAHAHPLDLGRLGLEQIDLRDVKSYQDMLARLRTAAAARPSGAWLVGHGWDQSKWNVPHWPTHDLLSTCFPDHPVVLERICEHAWLLNTRAMQLVGIGEQTPDPPGGKLVRVKGRLTGILLDKAIDLVRPHLPRISAQQRRQALLHGLEQCLKVGLTTLHDAGVDESLLQLYQQLQQERRLPLRIYALLRDPQKQQLERGRFVDPYLTVRAVKFLADGALGSRGAALQQPYQDAPNERGLLLWKAEELYQRIRQAWQSGFQVAVHAIGDRASQLVLDIYERFLPSKEDLRWRIEHAQVLHPEQIARFARLQVIASVQPAHLVADQDWIWQRLGNRARILYPWQAFLQAGARLAAGSDLPIVTHCPLAGLRAFCCPRHFAPEQALMPWEALAAYTTDNAYASFEEKHKACIKPGYLADLVVLNQDITQQDPAEWDTAVVKMTLVGGRLQYQAD